MEERRVHASWPTHDWESASPESQGMNSDILMHLHTFIQNQSLPIHAMLIARHGWLIFEHYYQGQKASDTQALRSCTKSVISALIGIALCKDSLHAFDQTLSDLLADEHLFDLDEQKRAITLYHLLTMVSGMDNLSSGRYHFEGHTNFVQAVFATPLFCPPGQTFRYGDPPVEVLGQLLCDRTVVPPPGDFDGPTEWISLGKEAGRAVSCGSRTPSHSKRYGKIWVSVSA